MMYDRISIICIIIAIYKWPTNPRKSYLDEEAEDLLYSLVLFIVKKVIRLQPSTTRPLINHPQKSNANNRNY